MRSRGERFSVWSHYARGEVGLWEAELRGRIEDWSNWFGLSEVSVRKQEEIVGEVLAYGVETLDALKEDIIQALEEVQERDNLCFNLTWLLSWSVRRTRGQLAIRPGVQAERASSSLASWVWRNLVKPWLPEKRRRLGAPYNPGDARVWAGALCWLLGIHECHMDIGLYLPTALIPAQVPCDDHRHATRAQQELGETEHEALKAFSEALARILRRGLGRRRESDARHFWEMAQSRLRPDDPLRNNPATKAALDRAYVAFGGDSNDVTGRERPLQRLAIFLSTLRPALWPPTIREDWRGKFRRHLKSETNRLRRELNLRGRPIRSPR